MDTRIFALDVLQKAAAKFTRFASFEFLARGEHTVEVVATGLAGIDLNAEQFAGLYRNEVLDQQLRKTVAQETESERNLILAYAFSNTKLIQS